MALQAGQAVFVDTGAWIALALVADGRARHGEIVWAVSPLAQSRVRVQVGPPCFIDPKGERLRG